MPMYIAISSYVLTRSVSEPLRLLRSLAVPHLLLGPRARCPKVNINSPKTLRKMTENYFKIKETKLRGFSPQANYTDRATAACRRS
jgi:hypothetical protein